MLSTSGNTAPSTSSIMAAIVSANFMALPPVKRPLTRTQSTRSCLPVIGSVAKAEPWGYRARNAARIVQATVTALETALKITPFQ